MTTNAPPPYTTSSHTSVSSKYTISPLNPPDLTLTISTPTSASPLYTIPVSIRSFPSLQLIPTTSTPTVPSPDSASSSSKAGTVIGTSHIRKFASAISCSLHSRRLTLEKKSMGLGKPSAYTFQSINGPGGCKNMIWKRDHGARKEDIGPREQILRLVDEEGRERARMEWSLKWRGGKVEVLDIGDRNVGQSGEKGEKGGAVYEERERWVQEVLLTAITIVEAKWRKDVAALKGNGGVGIVPSGIAVSGGMG